MWMGVQILIWAVFTILDLITVVVDCNILTRGARYYKLGYRGLQLVTFFGWWVTGMIIFFNRYNNCSLIPATKGMNNLVLGVLVYQCICAALMIVMIPLILLISRFNGVKEYFAISEVQKAQ